MDVQRRRMIAAAAEALGTDVETIERDLETLKEVLEKDVIYTGGFRFYGDAVVAECCCSKCGENYWTNYRAPRPFCAECDPPALYHRNRGLGRDVDPIEEAERRYNGEEIAACL